MDAVQNTVVSVLTGLGTLRSALGHLYAVVTLAKAVDVPPICLYLSFSVRASWLPTATPGPAPGGFLQLLSPPGAGQLLGMNTLPSLSPGSSTQPMAERGQWVTKELTSLAPLAAQLWSACSTPAPRVASPEGRELQLPHFYWLPSLSCLTFLASVCCLRVCF